MSESSFDDLTLFYSCEAAKAHRRRRRNQSLSISLRRRAIHLKRAHPAYLLDPRPENVDCVCEVAPYRFVKRTLGCGCRKFRFGRPHMVFGCSHGAIRHAVEIRWWSRRWTRHVLSGRVDAEDVPPQKGWYGMLEERLPRGAHSRM